MKKASAQLCEIVILYLDEILIKRISKKYSMHSRYFPLFSIEYDIKNVENI